MNYAGFSRKCIYMYYSCFIPSSPSNRGKYIATPVCGNLGELIGQTHTCIVYRSGHGERNLRSKVPTSKPY